MAVEYRVKKVSAYPIGAQFVSKFGTTQGKILKVTQIGLMAEIGETKFQPGDRLELSFEFPVLKEWLKEPGVVVKLYNKFNEAAIPTDSTSSAPGSVSGTVSGAAGAKPAAAPVGPGAGLSPSPHHGANFGQVMHMAEIHFKPLSEEGKKKIDKFLKLLSKP